MSERITDPDCLFCRIVAGEIPSRQVYADDTAVAFLDVAPLTTGHTLVVPRSHVADALQGTDVLAEILPAVRATAELLSGRLGATGINLLSNVGADAGQSVFHLHVHVVPRYADAPGLQGLLRPREDAPDLAAVHAVITGADEN